ncbi:MAG: 3-deoxy-manno-octulosonate cytidylyltransferase [Rickettsiaceae bacterium]|nr:3-deoxy-manno-octulosonate cytidylyltransferase [Rickettsiaceae bacterium]
MDKNKASQTLIIVPARIGSARLYQKPLALIGSKTMIEHVCNMLNKLGLENIFVATDNESVKEIVEQNNIKTIITDSSIATGTDRVYHAWKSMKDPSKFKYIVNIQGDMPFLDASSVKQIIECLWATNSDIVTGGIYTDYEVASSYSNVKIVLDKNNKALYFSRSLIPFNSEKYLYHLGVYGFKAEILDQFVNLNQSMLELSEKLEQLRALENGMSIEVCISNSEIPISIDTQEDLDKAIEYYAANF